MKRLIWVISIACLLTVSSQARQSGGQKRSLKLSIPSEQRPRLLLPAFNSVELSALSMERDDKSVVHLDGDVEIKTFWPGNPQQPLTILQADSATYDLNTGEIAVRSKMSVVFKEVKK
jgi:hypothetical protein